MAETSLQKVLRLSGRVDPGFIELYNENHDDRGEFSSGGGTAVKNNPSNFDFGKLARGEMQAGIGGMNVHPNELPIHVINNLSDVDLVAYQGRVLQAQKNAGSMASGLGLEKRVAAVTSELASRGLAGPHMPVDPSFKIGLDGAVKSGANDYPPGVPAFRLQHVGYSNTALDKVIRLALR
jgi:hypothetical protein